MNWKIISILLTIIGVVGLNAKAQTGDPSPISSGERQHLVDSVVSSYYKWDAISMSGKLSSPMLPVTASLKIYMEKDRLTVIAVSAPLIGEVARIEIDPNEALIVNKMKNTYTTVEMERIEPVCPGGLSALQNMLLGRINILGKGELNKKNSADLNIYDTGTSWTLLPEQDLENADFVYLYTLTKSPLQLERMIVITESGFGEAECDYVWGKKDLTLNLTVDMGGKAMEASVKLNEPDSKTKKMERIQLNSKYKRVDARGILKM